MTKFQKLLSYEARQLSEAFEHAKVQGKGTPQGISDFREIALTRFLERFFPYPYQIKKGNIIDSYGDQSQSIDCIILNPMHPKTITSDGKSYDLIIADASDYAIELKPNLTRKDEFIRLMEQCESVKRLRRANSPTFALSLNKLQSEHRHYVECLTREIPLFVYAENIMSDRKLDEFFSRLIESGESPHFFPDFIVTHQKNIIANVRYPGFILNIKDTGLFQLTLNEHTLAYFLKLLNLAHASVIHTMKPPIMHYFGGVGSVPMRKILPYDLDSLISEYVDQKPRRKS